MNFSRRLFLGGLLLAAPACFAITSDELARFLGVMSWNSKNGFTEDVELELYRIEDGVEKLVSPLDTVSPGWSFLIVAGVKDGHYHVRLERSREGITKSFAFPTKVPGSEFRYETGLPAEIREGNYILFGEPKVKTGGIDQGDVKSYAKGLVLRVKKRSK